MKLNGQELDDKNKTLKELDIENDSEIENENRVVSIKFLAGLRIYIICDENTTVREFLKKLKEKVPDLGCIRIIFAGKILARSTLDSKLLGCQVDTRSIGYCDTLHLVIVSEQNRDSNTVFDLNNLEESKN